MENDGLRWLRRRLVTEKVLAALRERAPETVIELRPRRAEHRRLARPLRATGTDPALSREALGRSG